MNDLIKEANQFFTNFINQSEKFDLALLNAYADDARIRTKRIMADGSTQNLEVRGSQWKQLLSLSLPIAQKRGDKNEYSNIVYTLKTDTVTIKADRYAVSKCYVDTGYYVVIQKIDDSFKIIEEYSETQMISKCDELNKNGLQEVMRLARQTLEGKLPFMVDEETRLDDVIIRGDAFEFQYTLVNMEKDDSFYWMFDYKIRPILLQQSCTGSNLRPILEYGGILSYLYKDKNGKIYAEVTVDREDCQNWESSDPRAVKETPKELLDKVQELEPEDIAMYEKPSFLDPCYAILAKMRGLDEDRNELQMIKFLPKKLEYYYLIFRFDGIWGSGGMQDIALDRISDVNAEILRRTAEAFRYYGDEEKALLIEELIPVAGEIEQKIDELNEREVPDDSLKPLWARIDAYDPRYESLQNKFYVYEVILEDMKKNVEGYTYRRKKR